MAKCLISCDIYDDKIYIHSGITSTILDSFASPDTGPSGLTYDGTNLISADVDTNTIYIHSGVTSTISSSFASPTISLSGLAYDGTNLISIEYYDDKIYIHSGVTSTISSSFASPAEDPGGLTYTGTNLISADTVINTIYIHSGITSTILDSFASPDPSSGDTTFLTYDGTNLISCEEGNRTIYIHSGVTSTISSSFASPGIQPYGLTYGDYNIPATLTTLAPTMVEDGIANLRLELVDKAGLIIYPVGWYCDENAAPSTEYIETMWRSGRVYIDLALGIYNKYVKTLPTGQSTLYVQAWADDSDDNRYTGEILSFSIPTEPEYYEFPDIIFPEYPEFEYPELPPWDINLPELPPWVYWDFPELPPLPPWFLPELPPWEYPDYPPMSFVGDFYYKKPYTKKDIEELRQKCINYEKNYADLCLTINHNTLLAKNFLQEVYNNGELAGESEMFAKVYPSQQLKPLYLDPSEPKDFKGIINRFVNNNISNSMGLNHNFGLFTEWLNDYNYTEDGYKASHLSPQEKTITDNDPSVEYMKKKVDTLQKEVATTSRVITHNFNLIKEIIQ